MAARHMPRVDAIGGSAAGIYIDNQPRVASLFRGITDEQFDSHIRPLFKKILVEWSKDRGCAFQYASQQAVARLLPSAGILVDPECHSRSNWSCCRKNRCG
jgi:hypothetical protein